MMTTRMIAGLLGTAVELILTSSYVVDQLLKTEYYRTIIRIILNILLAAYKKVDRPKFIQVMVNLRRLLSAIMKGSTSIFITVLVNHPCNMRYSIFYLGCEGEERNFKFVQSNESLATFK
uniref:Uncharacterized protein n=1 Tax=Salix viminalis TaxID=40686 RepID=A0A6N2N4Z1_SALVM